MNNSLDLGNHIEHCEESDLHADFKRTVRTLNRIQNTFLNRDSSWSSHPENQTTFSKVPTTPSDKSYSDTITKRTEQENILMFRDSIPSRIKMYNFNKALQNGKAKHLSLK